MLLSRFVRRRTVGVDSAAAKLAKASGQAGSGIEQLEPRVLLAADWSGASDASFATGPEYQPESGVERLAWRGGQINVAKGSWVVTFDQRYEPAEAERLARLVAAEVGQEAEGVRVIGRGQWAQIDFAVTPSEGAVREAVESLSQVRAVEPDGVYSTGAIPDDDLFGQTWQADNTGQFVPGSGTGIVGADPMLLEAWDLTVGDRDVLIAVIDTGVDMDHPDLAANIWSNPGEIPGNGIDDDGNGFIDDTNGWDFGEFDNDPSDVAGHGTPVSGTLGAVGNNGIGTVGVNWDVGIVPMKIADRFGRLSTSAIVGSHDYLTMMIEDFGHNIVASNNSYGAFLPTFYEEEFPEGFEAEKVAIEAFVSTGAAFVASAGNDANDNDEDFTNFPASYEIPGLISVAATDNTDALAGFSNYGASEVDIAAPGEQVFTTLNGGSYGYISGTSFSGPYIAGAVGMLKAFRPNASAVEIRQALIDSVDILPSLQGRVVSGGRLNMFRALQIIGADGPVATGFDPGPITTRIDADTGLPIDRVTVTFNKQIDGGVLGTDSALLTYAGADGEIGTLDDSDTLVPVSAVALASGETRVVDVVLDLSGVPQQRLPLGNYRLTLFAGTDVDPKIRDLDGNLLNGDSSSGRDSEYDFEVVGAGGNLEINDTLATATPVAFDGSGQAGFESVTLGDGLQAQLDVDLYRITLPRGGLITADITAANLQLPSDLDSYLRLFDANGEELANNDQFNGRDSYLDFFVTTGGTYYIGVSGFPNFDYDPTVAGSGRSQSVGSYNIEFGYERIRDDRLIMDAPISDPLPIPAVGTQGTMTSQITVLDARAIKDLNLRLDIDHSYVSDLEITLISPDGRSAIVFDRHGADGDDFDDLLLDDEAADPVSTATPPYSGSLRPTNGLNTFDGRSALGTWTLLIRDLVSLNGGRLNSWSLEFTLENNIFGAFESNDTPTTARPLDEIVGTGSATREAQIGDGGFGNLDRDLYEFTADAGATLTATATSSEGTLDTALRLFDASGNELKSSSPASGFDSTITSFVFPAGGTYYIAVSEGSNDSYDPFDVTSGSSGGTTGGYLLDVRVAPGISDGAAVLEGDILTVGVSDDGTFGDFANGDPYGLRFLGTDFLRSEGSGAGLTSMYGLTAGGYDFMNDGQRGAVALPMSLTNQTGPTNNRIVASGLFRDLQVERTLTFGDADNFLVFDVQLTNTGASDLAEVAWLEAFDPNQGLNLDTLSSQTRNDIDAAGRYASASVVNNAFPSGLTIAMGAPAADSRATATFYDPDVTVVRDPSQVVELGVNDPDGSSDDLVMALTYDLGTLAAGESTTMRYFVFLGGTPTQAQSLYDQVNTGTGAGHLTADSATPSTEVLSNGETVPTLSNRYYYPAGFSSPFIYSFVPMTNPNDQPTRVVVIARYETGERDDRIADFTLQPGARGGITVNTPQSFETGFGNARGSLVRPLEPYALEIRSERPIAATFSYFDTFLLDGERAAVGESFTATTSDTWTFASVGKFDGRFDFPVFQNTTDRTLKVTTTLLPSDGGEEIVLTQQLEAHRRGGWNLSALSQVPNGEYGMVVQAEGEIVASLSSYDDGTTTGRISASGTVGLASLGSLSGATPEGSIGLNAEEEIVGVSNANAADAVVTFSFLFENGSAYRAQLDVPGRSRGELDVASLPGFPAGQAYSIVYSSTVPVAMALPSLIFDDGAGTMFSDQAYTSWAFGAGFRPQNGFDQNVTEYLRLFNPSTTDVVVEITIRFDGNFEGTSTPLGEETFRRTVPARGVAEFDIHDFVTGDRREQDTFYGITVKSADPVVAYLGRYDAFFPGAFGTLGVPLGITSSI